MCANGHHAAQARGAHASPRWQGVERPMPRRDEGVARVFARRHTSDDEAFGKDGRKVFYGMNGEIGVAVEERLFDFLDEEALSTDFGQRSILDAVAAGDNLQLACLEGRVACAQRSDER